MTATYVDVLLIPMRRRQDGDEESCDPPEATIWNVFANVRDEKTDDYLEEIADRDFATREAARAFAEEIADRHGAGVDEVNA